MLKKYLSPLQAMNHVLKNLEKKFSQKLTVEEDKEISIYICNNVNSLYYNRKITEQTRKYLLNVISTHMRNILSVIPDPETRKLCSSITFSGTIKMCAEELYKLPYVLATEENNNTQREKFFNYLRIQWIKNILIPVIKAETK